MMRRAGWLIATTFGFGLLAACQDTKTSALGPLESDPDYVCATALGLAGGVARTNGDAATEARIVRMIQYYLGRVSARRPDEKWRSAWQNSAAKAQPGDVSKALATADDCSSRMAMDFGSH